MKKNDPISLIRFQVEEQKYTIVKDGKFYALFSHDNKLIEVYSNVTKGVGLFLAEIFDFKIKLPDKSNQLVTPPPSFLFLPYYVDQDISWQSSWAAFTGLQQIKNPGQAIIEYHIGLRSNEYYLAKGEIETVLAEMGELENERKISNNILVKLKEKLNSVDFSIDIDYFKNEIKDLLVECQKLKKNQDNHKTKLVDFFNYRITIETQIEVVRHTLSETRKDYKFALTHDDGVECPTCGSHFENSFSERFELAKDEDRCMELLGELTKDLNEINEKIEKENLLFNKVNLKIEKLEEILSIKKEEIKLRDLIENAGKKELNLTFQESITELNQKIAECAIKHKRLKDTIKAIDSKERRQKIKEDYLFLMKRNLKELDVESLKEEDYKDPTKNIKNTGSSLPRTLIAYYFSIFNLMKKYSSTIYCPIIIDSPNQQAQDNLHIEQILNFIKNNQVEESQLILGLEELYGVDFDCKVINFTEKYSLLQKSDYDEVYEEMKPFLSSIWQSGKTGSLFQF